MPVSPFKRAIDEGLLDNKPGDSGSLAGSGKPREGRAKRKPKPTSKAKHRKKKVKVRYSKAREDAQLEGVIPTTPDGAVKPERVPSSVQSEGTAGAMQTAQLVAIAIRNGWEVPKNSRQQFVDELSRVVLDPDMPAKAKIAAFNAMRLADKDQWERDHPVEAGQAKGAHTAAVSIQANVLAVTALREMFEHADGLGGGTTALPTPTESGTSGGRRFDGEVETGAASTGNQPSAGQGVVDAEQQDKDYRPIPAREEPTLLDILSRMGATPLAGDANSPR